MVIQRILILVLCVCLSSCATLSDSGEYYRKAAAFARERDHDAAFANLRALLNSNPHSAYAPKAAFGVAEYYYDNGDHLDATISFRKYINSYPKDDGVVFAELIIYKMATATGQNKNIPFNERHFLESIRKKMFSKPVFIIFKESKKESFSYTSVFGNVYSAFDHVDKITVKRNEREFFEISP